MTIGKAIKTCFRKYATFSGRASRSEYWWWQLFVFIITCLIVAFAILIKAEVVGLIFSLVSFLIFLLPNWSVTVRRYHDTNHNGWWILCPLYNVVLIFTPGDPSSNDYGEGENIDSIKYDISKRTTNTESEINKKTNEYYHYQNITLHIEQYKQYSSKSLYQWGWSCRDHYNTRDFEMLLVAALRDYPYAQELVGHIMMSPETKEHGIYNAEEAQKWLLKAQQRYKTYFEETKENANNGDIEAIEELADIYYRGKCNVTKNVELAEKYYRIGAEYGSETCQLWLGHIMKDKGEKEKALYWFTRSGLQGQGWAQYLVGEMYEKGEGTSINVKKAKEWYEKSSKTTNYYASYAVEALKRLK